jgi:hypothetical protein
MRRNGRLLIVLGVVLLLGALILAVVALSGGEDDGTPSADRPTTAGRNDRSRP